MYRFLLLPIQELLQQLHVYHILRENQATYMEQLFPDSGQWAAQACHL